MQAAEGRRARVAGDVDRISARLAVDDAVVLTTQPALSSA